VDVSISANKTVDRNSSLFFTICFTDAAKFAKSSLLQFKYKTSFILTQQIASCLGRYVLTRRYLITNPNNESSQASAFTSSLFELQIATNLQYELKSRIT
jgi:hypothetical protein